MERHDKIAEKERRSVSRRNAQEKNTETIRQFCSMICTLCPVEFTSFANVKQHYRTEHNQNGFLECCNKKYTKLHRVLEHCTRHFNPQKKQ